MGQTADLLGVGAEISLDGKTYQLAPLDHVLRARFETWLERRAFEKVRQHFSDRPEELREQFDATRRDVTAGVYSFGSPACLQATRCVAGLKKLLHLMLSEKHPEVDEAVIDRLFTEREAEVAAAISGPVRDESKKKEPPPAAG